MSYCPFCQTPLEAFTATCPTCYANLVDEPSESESPRRGGGTMIESANDVRDGARRSMMKSFGSTASPPPALPLPKPRVTPAQSVAASSSGAPVAASASPSVDDDTLVYIPVVRPHELKLCVLDDGSRTEGEWIRVRNPQFLIGRVEGDLVLPHDENISGRHCEIVRRVVEGRYRFYLRDLGSRNGTFIRISRAPLRADAQFLIGARRYMYRPGAADSVQETEAAPSTRGWEAVMPRNLQELLPSLVELTPQGEGRKLTLKGDEMTLGRDGARCGLHIGDDPFVSPAHAKVSKDNRGRWKIENSKSLNGLWLRIDEAPFDVDSEFQIGEQRFLVRLGRRN